MKPADPFEDAQLLLERARTHVNEFNRLAALGRGCLWDIRIGESADLTVHTADLVIDRAILRMMKAVLADAANNFTHSLEHIPAAILRDRGAPNPRDLYFPIADSDERYAKYEAGVRKHLGSDWTDLFSRVRSSHGLFLPDISLLRSLARTSRHWQLSSGDASASALQWMPPTPDPTHIEQIPTDHFATHDSFRFWERPMPFPTDYHVVVAIGHYITAEGHQSGAAHTVMANADTFVSNMIADSRMHLARRTEAQ